MKTKLVVLLWILLAIHPMLPVQGQEASDIRSARRWFAGLDSLCNLDNGRLWGVALYGPTLLVMPDTRAILANEPDKEGKLVEKDGIFTGTLPAEVNIANTSLEWGGKTWTMVNWAAVAEADPFSRNRLLIHESWHRVQPHTGIEPVMTANQHLDGLRGDILMKLEFIALSRALDTNATEAIRKHLSNALTLRACRQALFPANNEDRFERHEGMAEYTGLVLCGLPSGKLPAVAGKLLTRALGNDGLANSFAYVTGPAYGLLFDRLTPGWREEVKKGASLTSIGLRVTGLHPPADTVALKAEADRLASFYHAGNMIASETEKDAKQQQLIAVYRHRFLEGDRLILRNDNLAMSFNPQEKLVSVGPGLVYPTMRLSGPWGIAAITGGILRSNDWQFFVLPAPATGATGEFSANGYTLQLKDGWEVVKAGDGTFTLKQPDPPASGTRTGVPVIRAHSLSVDIRVDNVLHKSTWKIVPATNPDVYTTSAKRVTFLTDLDSIAFTIDPKEKYDFVILVDGKDSAHTRIVYEPTRLEILQKAGEYNLADHRPLPAFTYQSSDSPDLERIRKELKLDSVAGKGSELSQIFNLLHWVHNLVRHDGNSNNPSERNAVALIRVCQTEKRGVNCRMLATILNECYLAMGFPSRFVTCMPRETDFDDCHVINMVYSRDLHKWVWMDPTFDAYVMDGNGNLLGLAEVRERLVKGEPLVLNADANWNREALQTRDEYLDYYMAKNLYRFECPAVSEYNTETSVPGKEVSYIELLPLDGLVQSPQQQEIVNEKSGRKHMEYKTNNPDLFWAEPGK